ncbi:MAG: YfhO family protein [Spirochaetes bacterium]|nr:YfhO family protein [Spirochaetota bacterium]
MNLFESGFFKRINLMFTKSDEKSDLFYIILILLIILCFMMPAIFGREYLLRVDSHKQALPRLIAVSRFVQSGEIPLWDPNCFLGARPFYAMYESPIYNILLYPFYLFADCNNQTQAYYVLFLIPFILFVMISAVGSYLFSRQIIRMNKLGSLITGIVYALSPHMAISMMSLHNTVVFAYLPWVLFAACKFFEKRNISWWVIGVIFLAMLSTACNTNFTIRAYFVTAVILFFAWIFIYRKKDRSFMAFGLIIAMYIFSIILSAVMWLSVLEGISWLLTGTKFTYEQIVEYFTSNVWPGHLVTLFIPTFSGLNPGNNAWGNAIGGDHNIIFTGGLFIGLAIFSSLIFCINFYKKLGNDEKKKKKSRKVFKKDAVDELDNNEIIYHWLIIGFIIYSITILVMMGKYTPVYRILCTMLPWFFQVPFPFYYQFAQSWAASLLAGAGIYLLFNNENIIDVIFIRKYIFYYAAVVVFLGFITLIEKFNVNLLHDVFYLSKRYPQIVEIIKQFNSDYIYSWQSLFFLNKFNWFITNPVLYFFIFLILSILSVFFMKNEVIKKIMLIGLLFDSLFFGYITYFKNDNITYLNERNLHDYWTQMRSFTLEDYPYYKVAETVKKISEENKYRWMSAISDRDNMAWITNGRSAFGYDSKPLITEMNNVINSFMQGWPYELYSNYFPINYLRNINVKYLVVPEGLLDDDGMKIKVINGMKVYEIYNNDKIKEKEERGFNFFTLLKNENINLLDLQEPLPYIYTQDKLIKIDHDKQLDYLINENLKKYAVLDNDNNKIVIQNDLISKSIDDYEENFNDLQKANNIVVIKRTANTLELKADITKPSLLIRSDMYHKGWSVRVDGIKKELIKTNYMLQGVWLEKGEHTVKFSFFPDSIKNGLIITSTAVVILIILLLVELYLKRDKIRQKIR